MTPRLLPWRTAAGVVVWAAHFTAVYGYTALACERSHAGGIAWMVSAATVLAAAAAALIAWRSLRQGRADWLSAGVAALALFAIVLEGLPAWIVPPCA